MRPERQPAVIALGDPIRLAGFMATIACCLLACSSGPLEPIDALTPDASEADAEVSGPEECVLTSGQVCCPGEVAECLPEGSKKAKICNASGTAYLETECQGSDGRGSLCLDGACTACAPGLYGCDTEDLALKCDENGTWQPYQECTMGPGQVCAAYITGQPCQTLCSINQKFDSYIGCDYWAVDLDNAFVPGGNEQGYYDAAGAQYGIVVSNPLDSPRSSNVEIYQLQLGEDGSRTEKKVTFDSQGVPFPTAPLEPGELRVYEMPRRDVNGTVLAPLAYRVVSSAPIVAYQFNPLANENVFSNDASLLLPSTQLGTSYVVMTREQTFDTLRSYLTVVAVMPGETTVSVQVAAPTSAGWSYEGTDMAEEIPHLEPGESRIFTLEQYDVLSLQTDRPGADPTGSIVLATQRVAVFGGSEAANAPNTARCLDQDPITGVGVCEWDGQTGCKTLMDCVYAGFNTCCADHLEQQLFPVETWGTRYVATKTWDRGQESDIFRVVAAEDNTKIQIVPTLPDVNVVPVLHRGEWFEFESRQPFEIRSADADKPILVGQFLAAQDAPEPNVSGIGQLEDAGVGDPAFMLAVPVGQYRTEFVVLTPKEYEDNYINVTVPLGAEVSVDGEVVPGGYFEVIPPGEYSVYRSRIDPGPHTISASEPAGVMVYGYDQYVSYGYTGGLDLKGLNKGLDFGAESGEEDEELEGE